MKVSLCLPNPFLRKPLPSIWGVFFPVLFPLMCIHKCHTESKEYIFVVVSWGPDFINYFVTCLFCFTVCLRNLYMSTCRSIVFFLMAIQYFIAWMYVLILYNYTICPDIICVCKVVLYKQSCSEHTCPNMWVHPHGYLWKNFLGSGIAGLIHSQLLWACWNIPTTHMPASMIHCPHAYRNLFLKTWCSPASKALRAISGIGIMTQLLDPVYQVLSLATAYPSAFFSCFFNAPAKWSCSSPLISSVPLLHTCRNLHHNSLCLDTPSNSQILLILRSQPESNFL